MSGRGNTAELVQAVTQHQYRNGENGRQAGQRAEGIGDGRHQSRTVGVAAPQRGDVRVCANLLSEFGKITAKVLLPGVFGRAVIGRALVYSPPDGRVEL